MRFKAIMTLLLLCLATAGSAATLDVPGTYGTIAAALAAATSGDIVLVACGVYLENDLVMKSGVTLTSNTGGAYCATIDANGAGRAIICTAVDNTASIVGFTIKGGVTTGADKGAGILLDNSSPSIENCIIRNNTSAGGGGGMACINGSTPTLSLTTITTNTTTGAGNGGGILIEGSTPSIQDCIIENNTTSSAGGGIYADNSPFTFNHSNINENTSTGDGAAFYLNSDSDAQMTLLTIYGNYGGGFGGGIRCESSSPTITSCTIVENGSSNPGSGLSITGASAVEITKCIIAYNTLVEGLYLGSGTATITCTDIFGNVNETDTYNWVPAIVAQKDTNSNLCLNPRFCGTNSSGNYYLQSNSPCRASGACGELMGSRIVDCGEIAAQKQNWSTIKSLY
ncbi:MAG: hypothetical protein GY835_14830 [bacterium]|nr:hypothetical protein [bacterium]